MVNSVSSFNPLTFLSSVKGTTPPAQTTSSNSTDSSDSTDNSNNASSTLGISADVLKLLQGNNDSVSSTLSSLFGNSSDSNGGVLSALLGNDSSSISSSDPLAGVYNTLLYNVSKANPLQTAIDTAEQQQTQNATNNGQVGALLTKINAANNAYNQTLIQNAKAVQAANSYGPDGKPLVA